jgi:Calcium-binding EGF domain/EGF-like domain
MFHVELNTGRILSTLGVSVNAVCQNGGVCKDVGNSHRCQCRPGYEGSHCETDIDECASRPCRNGATCNNLIGRYSCDCAPGYQVSLYDICYRR